MATFGLRGIFRKINVAYLDYYNQNLYNNKYPDCQPYIPGAINIGFNVGIGYWVQKKQIVMFPNVSLGFDSGDRNNKHPLNNFPAYLELGCRILFIRKSNG